MCIVQANSGTIIQRVPSTANCLTFDGSNVWAGCSDGQVRRFDGQGNVIASYRVADGAVNDIMFDGTNMWTANFDDTTVSMINPATGALLASFPVGGGLSPRSLVFDGASVWILCSDFGVGGNYSAILKLFGSPPAAT